MPGIFLSARPTSIAQLAQERPCIAKTTRSVRGIIHHDTIARYAASHRRDPNRDEHAALDALVGVFTETRGEAPRTQGALGDAALSHPRMELEFHATAETTASRILRKRPGAIQVFLIILHEPIRLPFSDETSGAGGTEGRGGARCDSRSPRSRDSHLVPSHAAQRERRPRFRPRAEAFLAARRGLARAARGLGCAS